MVTETRPVHPLGVRLLRALLARHRAERTELLAAIAPHDGIEEGDRGWALDVETMHWIRTRPAPPPASDPGLVPADPELGPAPASACRDVPTQADEPCR